VHSHDHNGDLDAKRSSGVIKKLCSAGNINEVMMMMMMMMMIGVMMMMMTITTVILTPSVRVA
jgi:hypothetical protein